MNKSTKLYLISIILLLGISIPSIGHTGILKETWYMSRGKANMEIKNYKAAIEAFEQLVAIDPDNQEAMRLLGQAYENQGLIQKAIDHYDRYLNRFPKDAKIAFKQAHFLEDARFAYRRKDCIKYYRMGLAVEENFNNRHRLAKLLAANKTTIDDAVDEYQQLLKTKPDNPSINKEYRNLLLWDDRYLNQAIDAFERAVAKYPDNLDYRHKLARLYFKHPGHVKDAISEYRLLVESSPKDVKLRREYAKALAKNPSDYAEAQKQFEIVLEQKPTFGTRLAYANHLAKRRNNRDKALAQYKQLLTQKPGSIRIRLEYAKLLGGEKKDLDAAIYQYKWVLKSQPKNSAAHQGLAHAYAWKGDNDMAIYHSKLALEQQPKQKDTLSLKNNLMQGREPKLDADITFFRQVGDKKEYDYKALIFTTGFCADLTPFLTGQFHVGHEKFWEDDKHLDANTFRCDIEYRFDPVRKLNLYVKHHALNGTDVANEASLSYTFFYHQFMISPGFERLMKMDSLLSIGGISDPLTGRHIGAARLNKLYCQFLNSSGRFETTLTPYIGQIYANQAGTNLTAGMDLLFDFKLRTSAPVLVNVIDDFKVSHYAKDHSGFKDSNTDPMPGGYYSPKLYVRNLFGLKLDIDLKQNGTLTLLTGPSVDFAREHNGQTNSHKNFNVGADAHLTYLLSLKKNFLLRSAADYTQVSDIYNRFDLSLMAIYKF